MNPVDDDERALPSGEGGAAAASEPPAPQDAGRGGTDVQAYIGRQLRAVYDDVVKQPIPDRFLALMQQLEDRQAKG